jgi:hypothetical protein
MSLALGTLFSCMHMYITCRPYAWLLPPFAASLPGPPGRIKLEIHPFSATALQTCPMAETGTRSRLAGPRASARSSFRTQPRQAQRPQRGARPLCNKHSSGRRTGTREAENARRPRTPLSRAGRTPTSRALQIPPVPPARGATRRGGSCSAIRVHARALSSAECRLPRWSVCLKRRRLLSLAAPRPGTPCVGARCSRPASGRSSIDHPKDQPACRPCR